MPYCKKPIEVVVLLDAINRKAARKKATSHGHPSAPRLWYRTPHAVYLQLLPAFNSEPVWFFL